MKKETESLGQATIGYGTQFEQKVDIADYVQCEFKDHRLVSVSALENGAYALVIENPSTTGRCPYQSMLLSKESLTALLNTIHIYAHAKGWNLETILREAADNGDMIDYKQSSNLSSF